MRRSTRSFVLGAICMGLAGLAQAQSAADILSAGCAEDAQKLCDGVQPGGGRIVACLKQHREALSAKCKQAAAQSSGRPPAMAPTASPPSAVTAADAVISAPVAATRAVSAPKANADKASHASPASPADAAGSYLLMKKVSVNGPGPDAAHPTQTAFDVMIPSTWNFTGNVTLGGGKGGCFADLFALSLEATSPDGAVKFQVAPDYSWQYADDPQVMKSLTDPKRRALGAGGKPCATGKPLKAEEYVRQNIVPLFPSGTTVVSMEPYPALNEIVRQRRGLPPGDANTGATRTEAVRARLTFQKDGKDLEEWVAVAIVSDMSRAGRGTFYDIHATSLIALTAPKGKLDANEKIFKVIVSSIRPQPQWTTYANQQLVTLYRAEAQKEASIDKMRTELINNQIAAIQGVTANMVAGASVSAMRADQNIRNVQTFRDPQTGKTLELSNLYDHAWLNGANQYVMSDDPNFEPNGNLSGSWSRLQAVNPSP